MRITLFIRKLAMALALATLGAASAWAQTYSPKVTTAPDLGVIVPAATTSTTFSFSSSSGTVTQSGGAVRRTSGTTRALVTIGCTGGGADCGRDINVRVGSIGAPTGKAGALSAFEITANSGSISSLSGTNPVSFTIAPQNKNTEASFYIGATLPIAASNSAGAFGAATSQFFVYVARNPATPTTGVLGTVSATTYRGVSVSGTTLNFGKVTKPNTGTVTVTLDPATNGRAVSAGNSPSTGYSRATFTITGENSMAVTVSQDSMLMLTGPGPTIPVTLTHTAFPTVIGSSGTTGSQGTSTFNTGGSFSIGPGQTVGVYSGSYSTTVSYN